MLDKYTLQIDRDLFLRFVEAIERIAPPPARSRNPHSSTASEGEEADSDDLISMTDAEYAKVDLQGQLDDLVETLSEKGYREANKDELDKLAELKQRIRDADMEDLDGNSDD